MVGIAVEAVVGGAVIAETRKGALCGKNVGKVVVAIVTDGAAQGKARHFDLLEMERRRAAGTAALPAGHSTSL